jgi:carbonic anhydrase
MREYKHLLLANKAWAAERLEERADYFERQIAGQQPEFLWIGCSDSRVAAGQLTNTPPGGMFIHRNVANLVNEDDINLMSVLEYAVTVLKVRHIIICGHHGCGGINAALAGGATGYLGQWLANAEQVYRDHADEIDVLPMDQRANRLVELNVRDQLVRLARTSVVQDAFAANQTLYLHGWVYDLRDGLIKPMMEIDATTPLGTVPRPEPVLV